MKRVIVIVAAIFLGIKIWIAWRLPLFGDEAFYWQCAQRLQWAYADLPPLTALLVRCGTAIAGDSPLGVRWPFLAIGTVAPLCTAWLARPLVGSRDATLAAGLVLICPAFATLGLFALPDVPLIVLEGLFLAAVERGTRTGSARDWGLAGGLAALGFLVHYRFGLAPLSVAIWLVAGARGRECLRGRGPWIALALGLPGLFPGLIYNLRTGFAPLGYFLGGRHGGAFDASKLVEHVVTQAALVGPPLYVVLVGAVLLLVRRARAGDARAALLLAFALTHLGVYLIASPFEDSNLATAHWPLAGYVALLPFAPAVGRRKDAETSQEESPGHRGRIIPAVVCVVGLALISVCLLELSTGVLRIWPLRKPFAGWAEAGRLTREYMEQMPPGSGGRRIVVADNYKLGANLEFHLGDAADVYVLDHPRNRKHGRAAQFERWGIGEESLRRRGGEPALLVYEFTLTEGKDRPAWQAHLDSFFAEETQLPELLVERVGKRGPNRQKVFRFHRGTLQ